MAPIQGPRRKPQPLAGRDARRRAITWQPSPTENREMPTPELQADLCRNALPRALHHPVGRRCAETIQLFGRMRPFFAWWEIQLAECQLSVPDGCDAAERPARWIRLPPEEKTFPPAAGLCPMSNTKKLQALYFAFAFCAAQRLRCASAIFLRASALNTRFFLVFAFAGAFLALLPALVVVVPMLASSLRACESRAISESIWASMFSMAIYKG